jgi:hypothetical protein
MICQNPKCVKEFFDRKHPNRKYCSRQCIIKTKEWLKKMSESQSGPNHHRWKGGSYISDKGYKMAYDSSVPKRYVYEHRQIMEKHLGRKLTKNEIVHHINENRLDNRIENLELLTNKKMHMDKHKIWLQQTEEGIKKMGLAHKGISISPEILKALHDHNKGLKRTPEQIERLKQAWIIRKLKKNL